MKICSKCKQEKPFDQFNRNRSQRDGRDNYCKPCRSVLMKRPDQQVRARAYYREKVAHSPRRKETVRRGHFRRRYGITLDDYNTMLVKQDGRCAICGDLPTEKRWLAVDHCHKTGKVRGLLCSPCNRLLHKLETDDNWIKKACAYLS